MMPVVSASITDARVARVGRGVQPQAQGHAQLAMEGHWILDGLDRPAPEHIEPWCRRSRDSSWSG